MLTNIIEKRIVEGFEFITFEVEDDKVSKVMINYNIAWNKVIDITIYFKTNRIATYSGNLSNHKMPPKYRKYIKEAMKKILEDN